MYTVLVEGAPSGTTAVTACIRRAPYITRDRCIRAAHLVKAYVPKTNSSNVLYPLANLLHTLPLKPARNQDLMDPRVRWAIAHDVGHWLLKHPQRALWYLEIEADIFARELLMPMHEVKRLWKGSIRDLAALFRVPVHKAAWAVQEYFGKSKMFDCPLLPTLECGSLQAISECRKLGEPHPECITGSQEILPANVLFCTATDEFHPSVAQS